MGLLFFDGSSFYSTTTLSQRYSFSSSPVVEPTSGHWNATHRNGRLLCDTGADFIDLATNNTDSVFIAQWYNYTQNIGLAGDTQNSHNFRNNSEGITHVTMRIKSNGCLQFLRGGTTTILISESMVRSNNWHYLEVALKISDTVGQIHARVDGKLVLNEYGLDTKNGGTNAWVDTLRVDPDGNNTRDIYVCNPIFMSSTGSSYNNFIGPKRVYTCFPTGGDTSNWTRGSTGSTNWQLVDETDPDGDSTFVESASTGTVDLYQFENLPSNCSVVDAVAINFSAKDSTGGTSNMRAIIDSTGNISNGATVSLTSSYAIYQTIFMTDPNGGGAWTPAAVNNLLAGIEVVA